MKDAFHEYVINGKKDAVNPKNTGTKVSAYYVLELSSKGRKEIRLRLSASASKVDFCDFDEIFTERIKEADEFFAYVIPSRTT